MPSYDIMLSCIDRYMVQQGITFTEHQFGLWSMTIQRRDREDSQIDTILRILRVMISLVFVFSGYPWSPRLRYKILEDK